MTKKTTKPKNVNRETLRKILKQLAGDVHNIDGALVPEMIIQGEGIMYCYSPHNKEHVKVGRGTRVYLIEQNDGKALIYTFEGHVVEIEEEELIYIGFD
jgi:uncharacterized protein YlaN (UPF0358 family)